MGGFFSVVLLYTTADNLFPRRDGRVDDRTTGLTGRDQTRQHDEAGWGDSERRPCIYTERLVSGLAPGVIYARYPPRRRQRAGAGINHSHLTRHPSTHYLHLFIFMLLNTTHTLRATPPNDARVTTCHYSTNITNYLLFRYIHFRILCTLHFLHTTIESLTSSDRLQNFLLLCLGNWGHRVVQVRVRGTVGVAEVALLCRRPTSTADGPRTAI